MFSCSTHFNFAISTFSTVYQNRNQGTCSTKLVNGLKVIPALGALVTGSALWTTQKVVSFAAGLLTSTSDNKPHLAPRDSSLSARLHHVKHQIPHIPSKEELEKLSEEELHRLWKMNNEALIGVIAREKIPKFGFHGTNAAEEILKTKVSKGYLDEIYVAGYVAQLDPITFLADLYTIATKASAYGTDCFVVRTDAARDYHKNINALRDMFEGDEKLDSEQDRAFLKFTWRNRGSDMVTYQFTKEDLKEFSKSKMIPSKCFFPTSELKLKFNPENFDERIKGVLFEKKRICNSIYSKNVTGNYPKLILAGRFRIQELILYAFEKIQVIKENSWQGYQDVGEVLMRQIDRITKLSDKQLGLVKKRYLNDLEHECFMKLR